MQHSRSLVFRCGESFIKAYEAAEMLLHLKIREAAVQALGVVL